MTRDEAISLISEYSEHLAHYPLGPYASNTMYKAVRNAGGMFDRFPEDGSKAKAMRWLGYLQGVAVTANIFTLEDVKQHSMRKWVKRGQ